jgi:glycosyltransferase involved in cell wall biosynthesis
MPLKIIFLSHSFYPNIGGIEVNSEILAEAFFEAGHQVRLLTWSEDSTGRAFPFPVIRNPTKRRLFQEHAWADLVFENNPCIRLAWPGLFFGRPSIISLNTWLTDLNRQSDMQDWFKSIWLKRASKVISVSEALRQSCWPAATVIGNPYRADEFKILPDIDRTTDFIFVGRLVSQKGADLAILALHRLLTANQLGSPVKPSLTIVGDGPERSKLEVLAAELNITDHVSFTGFLRGEALVRCLNRHRFLLVPSVFEEAFGNVVLEGMACGCLPIVSNSGGLPEAVSNAGLVFNHGDVDMLVASILKLMNDRGLQKQLRAASFENLAAHQPQLVTQRYLAIIDSIELTLGNKSKASGRKLITDNNIMTI